MQGLLFVALYHSAKIVTVELNEAGDSYSAEVRTILEFPCLSDEIEVRWGTGHKPCVHEHPLDLAFAPDGSLFISAFGTISGQDFSPKVYGKIYRIGGY